MAQTLADIMASLAPTYDPQEALVAKQQAALPGQEQAAVSGLETAKTNAFNDITGQANERGLLYSGMPIAEQSRYVGEKYLPALAGVKSDFASRGSALEQALLQVRQARSERAQQIRDQQIAQDLAAQQLADQRAKAAAANQGLNLAGLFGGAQSPAVDPVSAARGFAKTAKQQLLAAGNVQPFAREAVLQDLINQFGLDPKTAQSIIYKEIFPDNWAGGGSIPRYVAAPASSLAASNVGKQFGYGF